MAVFELRGMDRGFYCTLKMSQSPFSATNVKTVDALKWAPCLAVTDEQLPKCSKIHGITKKRGVRAEEITVEVSPVAEVA